MATLPPTTEFSFDPSEISLSEAQYSLRLLQYALWQTQFKGKELPDEFQDLAAWVKALAKWQSTGNGPGERRSSPGKKA